MHADWIDHWGALLQRVSRRLCYGSMGLLAVAALAALALPKGSQMILGAILDRSQESHRVSLPTADGSFSIKIRQLPLFHDEGRYQAWVFRTTETGEGSLGSRGSWDGLTPLVIYEHGPNAVVIRMRGRGYDTYGRADAATQETRRYLGMIRLLQVRGRRQVIFLDGRATQECNPDGEVGRLPACALSP